MKLKSDGVKMEKVVDLLSFFNFFGIYGIAGLSFLIYLTVSGARNHFKNVPNPSLIAGMSFFLLMVTSPTADRYKFKQETFLTIQKYEGYQITGISNWGAFTEPLTFFYDFPGSIQISKEEIELSKSGYPNKYFHTITFRYKEDKSESLYEVNCANRKMSVLKKNASGSYVNVTGAPFDMDLQNSKSFCP